MKFARGHFYVPLYKPGATVYLHSQLKAVDKGMQMRVWSCIYCNSLFFRYKNIFVHRKRTKIFYTNIILQQKFF